MAGVDTFHYVIRVDGVIVVQTRRTRTQSSAHRTNALRNYLSNLKFAFHIREWHIGVLQVKSGALVVVHMNLIRKLSNQMEFNYSFLLFAVLCHALRV